MITWIRPELIIIGLGSTRANSLTKLSIKLPILHSIVSSILSIEATKSHSVSHTVVHTVVTRVDPQFPSHIIFHQIINSAFISNFKNEIEFSLFLLSLLLLLPSHLIDLDSKSLSQHTFEVDTRAFALQGFKLVFVRYHLLFLKIVFKNVINPYSIFIITLYDLKRNNSVEYKNY